MFSRLNIRRVLRRSIGRGATGSHPLTPVLMSRDAHNDSSEQTRPSSSNGPSQTKPTPPQRSINLATARWSSAMDPRPLDPILFQDVRDWGPLFNLSKIELDSDPETAKQQWRSLCVQHQLKQKTAYQLWKQNKELEVRCTCAEMQNSAVLEALAAARRTRNLLEGEIKWLKDAEAKHEQTRGRLDTVSRVRMDLAMSNARLVTEVQAGKKTVQELRQIVAEQADELAAARRGQVGESGFTAAWGVAFYTVPAVAVFLIVLSSTMLMELGVFSFL
ncbi:hypothetical protein F4803DRAFT_353232 [Xylaria telfairii]|nr:hypothetical protein F4803DRAFT_353232 [Xylaria telfairii]